LGQLIGKKVGNTVGSTPLQEVDYYYNIRGWLKSINDIAELGTQLRKEFIEKLRKCLLTLRNFLLNLNLLKKDT
jgi:hypothetical protein